MNSKNYKAIAKIIKSEKDKYVLHYPNLWTVANNIGNDLANYLEKRAEEGIKRNHRIAKGLKDSYGIYFHNEKGFNRQQFLKDGGVDVL